MGSLDRVDLELLSALADELGFSLDTPWRKLPKNVQQHILYVHLLGLIPRKRQVQPRQSPCRRCTFSRMS